MRHTNVTSPFVHTRLTNGMTYYLVVTAVDASGRESRESVEASATPFLNPPPTLILLSPAEGETVKAGSTITIRADTTNNVRGASVRFTINGVVQPPNQALPYVRQFMVSLGISTLTIEVVATDYIGRTASATRTVAIVP